MVKWLRGIRNGSFVALLTIMAFAVQVQDLRAEHCSSSGHQEPVCETAWAGDCVYQYDPCGQNAQSTCDALCQHECGLWYADSVVSCESMEWAPDPWRLAWIECQCHY